MTPWTRKRVTIFRVRDTQEAERRRLSSGRVVFAAIAARAGATGLPQQQVAPGSHAGNEAALSPHHALLPVNHYVQPTGANDSDAPCTRFPRHHTT